MITRYTFYFNQDNIRSDVSNDEESTRITAFIKHHPHDMLKLPGDNADIYVNLALVKCIGKMSISQEQLDAEKAAAPVAPPVLAEPTPVVPPAEPVVVLDV
jgi:hypothetical protein